MTQKISSILSVMLQTIVLVFWLLCISAKIAVAADINLTLHTHSIDDNVTVTVENSSKQALGISAVYIELDDKKYEAATQLSIPAFSTEQFSFQVKLPKLPGSYFNDGNLNYGGKKMNQQFSMSQNGDNLPFFYR